MKNGSTLHARTGFSLVEVTLALAVIAVGLLAVLGLLPQGLNSSRAAADNTLVATIVQDIFSDVRSQSFTNVNIVAPGNPAYDHNLTTYAATDTLNFDASGLSVAGTAYYQVVVGYNPQSPLLLSRITATVVWPAQAAAPINTNVFVTMVAQR